MSRSLRAATLLIVAAASAPVSAQSLLRDVPASGIQLKVSNVGDIDADGIDDVATASTSLIRVYSGLSGAPILNVFLPSGFPHWHAAAAGDADGDGIGDVVAGASNQVLLLSGATGNIVWQVGGSGGVVLGETVAGIGDIDGDNRPDVATGGYVWTPGLGVSAVFGAVYSGPVGAFLGAVTAPGFSTTSRARVARGGRLDGDAIPDLLLVTDSEPVPGGLTGVVRAFSGADGSLIRMWAGQSPGEFFGSSVDGGTDIDLDGFDDVVITAAGPTLAAGVIRVYSGGNGGVIHAITGPAGGAGPGFPAVVAGDVDLDQRPEIAARTGPPFAPTFLVYRGSTAALLTSFSPWTALTGVYGFSADSFCAAGDVNTDDRAELAFAGSRPTTPPGSGVASFVAVWSLASVTAPAVASAYPLATNCLQNSAWMILSRPVLGTTADLWVSLPMISGASGVVYLSPVPPGPPPPFGGCTVFVDPAAMLPFASFASNSGWWTAQVPIPPNPLLGGITGRLQAVVQSGSAPPLLSNGMEFTLGQ